MRSTTLFLLAFLLPFAGMTQVAVTSDLDAETLVADFLLGSGVLIENVTFSGSDVQIGAFYDDSVIGMDSGFVMSSADVLNIVPPGGFADVDFSEGVSGDADLLSLANDVPTLLGESFYISEVHNVASVEFDFVPYGDSLSFRYVFGSDEYLEWVNTAFNDVFGFFVSGPGIDGPYANGAINIAYVPESDPQLPITVSSVNNITNPDYYIDNVANEGISIDGYTTVISACLNELTIGETYHMRLAIADGSDMALESVVCLEAGSFSSYVTTEPGGPGDFDGDGDIDINDLLFLIAEFGCTEDCVGDLDGDGVVGVGDILFFLGLF